MGKKYFHIMACIFVFAASNANADPSAGTNPANAQNTAQQKAADTKEKGADMTKIMGIAQGALGAVLIAHGMHSAPPNAMEIAMGGMMLLQAALSLKASKEMATDAAIGNTYKDNLNSGITPITGSTGGNNGGSIGLTPDDLKGGSVGMVMDQFEKASGISRDDFANALASGQSPEDALRNSGMGVSDAAMQKALADGKNMLSSNPGMVAALQDKYGLSDLASQTGASTGAGTYADAAGGGSAKGSGSLANTNLDDFLNGLKNKDDGKGVGSLGTGMDKLSPEVKASLAKNGITDKSLFQMITTQYQKNMPMIFGQATASEKASRLPDGPKVDKIRMPASLPTF